MDADMSLPGLVFAQPANGGAPDRLAALVLTANVATQRTAGGPAQ